MNLLLKLSDNNYKKKKEKVWVYKNMQGKNIINMKKILLNKKEKNKKFKNSIKD